MALEALDTLATTDRRIAPALMRAVEGIHKKPAFPDEGRLAWYSAALDALLRIDAPALAPWIVERLLSPDKKRGERTSAALTTLGGVRDLKGLQRRSAVKGIFKTCEPFLRRNGVKPTVRDLQLDALVAIHRLAGPDAKGLPDLRGRTTRHVFHSVRSWWLAHRAQTDPAWAD